MTPPPTGTLIRPAQARPDTADNQRGPKPLLAGRRHLAEHIALWCFVTIPLLAVAAAVPIAWGWGLTWRDVTIFAIFYVVAGLGITVGFHRYLTHGSFKAKRWMRVVLTIMGCLGIEGSPVSWVSAHRRHHQYSDKEGDPHSPWAYGENLRGLTKGFIFAHMGWLFQRDKTNAQRFAPDLLADKDIQKINKYYIGLVTFSAAAPLFVGGIWAALAGDAIIPAALSALFWGGLVRIALLHHVTWSINSVCHIIGDQPFESKDKAANFWPLAILSFGESWHNLHHADPTCARHGVLRGQLDPSARFIWLIEKCGWVYNVKWPKADRLEAKRVH